MCIRDRNNTVSVMKFREYPETYEKLKEILGEEAKYYKISQNDLLKDFNKQFFNVGDTINLQNLKEFPKQFNPTFFVQIKNSVIRTELPKELNEEQDSIAKEYKIKPSEKGYSFILKIDSTKSKSNGSNGSPKTSKSSKSSKITEYAERGSVVGLSLKPEYFKSDKLSLIHI